VSVTLDAGEVTADLQRHGVHVALHGHQHVPFLARLSRAWPSEGCLAWQGLDQELYVVGMGSSGAAAEYLNDHMRDNTFGVYTPLGDRLHVRVFRFNRALPVGPFLDRRLSFGRAE
jgi:hypothetical protein